MQHEVDQRIECFTELMEYVRLPLLKLDILYNISKDPLLKNISKRMLFS